MISARVAQMVDSSNRNELMIIYAQSAAASGTAICDVKDVDGKPTPKRAEAEKAFLARAVVGLEIEPAICAGWISPFRPQS